MSFVCRAREVGVGGSIAILDNPAVEGVRGFDLITEVSDDNIFTVDGNSCCPSLHSTGSLVKTNSSKSRCIILLNIFDYTRLEAV